MYHMLLLRFVNPAQKIFHFRSHVRKISTMLKLTQSRFRFTYSNTAHLTHLWHISSPLTPNTFALLLKLFIFRTLMKISSLPVTVCIFYMCLCCIYAAILCRQRRLFSTNHFQLLQTIFLGWLTLTFGVFLKGLFVATMQKTADFFWCVWEIVRGNLQSLI